MSVDGTTFVAAGMNYVAATELARQISGTPNADALVQLGLHGPLALELVRQVNANSGSVSDLVGLGVPSALAEAIKAAIDTR
jgi:hypothetical protein